MEETEELPDTGGVLRQHLGVEGLRNGPALSVEDSQALHEEMVSPVGSSVVVGLFQDVIDVLQDVGAAVDLGFPQAVLGKDGLHDLNDLFVDLDVKLEAEGLADVDKVPEFADEVGPANDLQDVDGVVAEDGVKLVDVELGQLAGLHAFEELILVEVVVGLCHELGQ